MILECCILGIGDWKKNIAFIEKKMMIFSDIVLPCIKDDIGFWKRAGNGSSSAPFFPSRDEALSGKGETKKTRSHRHKNGRKKKENANTPKKMIKKRKPRWMKRGWRRWPVDVHFRLLRPAVTKIKIKEKKAVSNSDFVALTSVARCRWRPARLTRRARKVPPPSLLEKKKLVLHSLIGFQRIVFHSA